MNSYIISIFTVCILLISSGSLLLSQNETINYDTLNIIGNQNIPAKFFRERYLNNDVEQYLDNYQEFIIYQNETVGDLSKPNRTTFSIMGNSYRWNKYYVNNFRINDHYFTGSMLHKLQTTNYGLELDLWNTSLGFISDTLAEKGLMFSYNHGGNLGGIGPGTEALVHMFHRTAREALYIPIEEQRRVKNSLNLFVSDEFNIRGKLYRQNISITYGRRLFPDFDYLGITKFNQEGYYLFNANGQLPSFSKKLFTESNYLLSINQRENMFSEFYYNSEETAKLNAINLSLFGSNMADKNKTLSSGFNISYKNIRHNNLNFARNVVDQDGEGFEPWYPNADVLEISHAVFNKKKLNNRASFVTDMYNSFINHSPMIDDLYIDLPVSNIFYNPVYFQSTDTNYQSLYIYDWQSNTFNSGILENTYGLEYKFVDSEKLKLSVQPDATFDALILSNKSLYRINWQADFRAFYSPFRFLQFAIIGGRKRVALNYEQARYLSDDYMNANIYYWNDNNNNKVFENGELSDLYSTTGGYYHKIVKDIKQTAYYYFDLPIKIKARNHSLLIYGFYRQFANTWQTVYAENEFDKGFLANPNTQDVYLLNNGEMYYRVQNTDEYRITRATGLNSFLFNNPFSLGYTLKYQMNSERWLVSVSWTAMTVSGHGAIGNGPIHNDVAALSESTANPNRYINYYGRLDSDRAYIARMIFTYKQSKKLSWALQIKYKDGQPFTDFDSYMYSDGENTQIALWENHVKGDNFFLRNSGARKDAFFNTVLRAEYKCKIMKNDMAFNLAIYNIYDFGTELAEYTFKPLRDEDRYVLELNIPRGIIASVKYLF